MRQNLSAVRLRRLLATAAYVGLLALGSATTPALAQSGDMRELVNRLGRLETEMQTLSREVYRGGGRPAAGAGGQGIPSNVAGDFEVRLQRLESEMQTLTGRYEEAAFQVGQLRDQLAKMQQDLDFRLQRLEQGGGGGGGLSVGPGGAPSAGAASGGGANQSAALPSSPPVDQPASDPGAGNLPSGSAQEQYDYAFNLLRQADYANAEKAFGQFLKSHPNHSLSANAQYWLAETLYVRNKFKESAVAFAEGYQKFPKSNKAADSLLKLAMSLSNLKQRDDACLALQQLQSEYRDAPATIKRRAEQEKNRLKCS